MALTKVDGEGVGTLDSLNITESNNGATEGPSFELHRNSASPADNDVLGALLYTGKSSTGADKTYSSMNGFISNVANANASGGLIFNTRNSDTLAERMRIDASGKVGIGLSSAEARLDILGNSDSVAAIKIGPNASFGHHIYDSSTNGDLVIKREESGTQSETMRLTRSGGNVLVGTTTSNYSATNGFGVIAPAAATYAFVSHPNGTSNSTDYIAFSYNGSRIGNITQASTSSVAYNTSSDYRMKENVTYDWDATTRLKQLKPARFNFIADADTTVDGFLAHEAQAVVPEAVTGTHNEVDDDGNPVMQGIDQSKIVPLLVKTILELEARIVALETA